MKVYPPDVLDLIVKVQKALPKWDFNDVEVKDQGGDLFYFLNIKDNVGEEHRLNVRNRKLGGPEIVDVVTDKRYWPDVK